MATPNGTLGSVLDAISANTAEASKSASTYEDIVSRQLDAQRRASELRGQGVDSSGRTPEQVQQELQGKMSAEQAAITLRNRAGMTGDASDIMLKLIDENNAYFEQAKQAKAEVDAKESVDFFDNPLGYIVNQLTVGDSVDKYNAVVDQYNLNANHMKEINDLVQEGATTYNATKQTVTDAVVASATKASLAMIQAESAAMEAQTYKSNADAVRTVFDMKSQEVQNTIAAYGATNQAKSLEIQQAHLKLAQEEAARQRAKDGSDDDMVVKAYVAGFKSIHGIEPPVKNAKDLKAMAMSPTLKEQISKYIDRGLQVMYQMRGEKVLGITPSDTLDTVRTLKVPLSDGQQKVYDALHQEALRLLKDPATFSGSKGLVKPPKTAAEQQNWIDTYVATKAKSMLKEVNPDDKSNIYSIPPMETILQANAVQQTEGYKKVFKAVVDSGIKDISTNRMVDLLSKAVAEKKITAAQAVEFGTTYYGIGVMLNNQTYQYSTMAVPSQEAYNTRIKLPGYIAPNLLSPTGMAATALNLGEESKVYNLTNENDWKTLILRHNMSPLTRIVK